MRVAATHIVLEHSGRMSDKDYKFRKVYELTNGDYMVEMDGEIVFLEREVFAQWADNYKIFLDIKQIK